MRRRGPAAWIPVAIAVSSTAGAGATWSTRACAQPGGDKVTAEALFEDARKLVAEGKYADACPKFADSERLDPSPSTVLNLANCWEKLGKTATAWATYKQAQSEATAAKRADYASTAERHADALAPTLARLTIAVPQSVDGLQLKRDGIVLEAAEWGAGLPIDTGAHLVEASAPGYKKWSASVDVPRDGARVTIAVPALEPLPAPPPGAPPPPAESTSIPALDSAPDATRTGEKTTTGDAQRTIGIVVGAVGLAALGTSGVLAGLASGKNTSSNRDGC